MTNFSKKKFQEILNNETLREQAIGRALVHLFNRQTEAEKQISNTNVENDKGFTKGDAKTGSITAKYFIKTKKLENWMVQEWFKTEKSGYSRIAKYWSQIAEEVKRKELNKQISEKKV